MMRSLLVWMLLFHVPRLILGFTKSSTTSGTSGTTTSGTTSVSNIDIDSSFGSLQDTSTALQSAHKAKSEWEEPPKPRRCERCPEPDYELGRRELFFSTLGAVLATTSSFPALANAVYGADANIEVPNVVDSLNDRATKQCMVESLGNRECLVYLDPANKLYQGADGQVLLERIEKASVALATVPSLIEERKWSKVVGVLTGPMGTLVGTMDQLTKLSENGQKAAELAKKTKTDIIAISQFAERKQGDKALQAHGQATESLVAFVKSL